MMTCNKWSARSTHRYKFNNHSKEGIMKKLKASKKMMSQKQHRTQARKNRSGKLSSVFEEYSNLMRDRFMEGDDQTDQEWIARELSAGFLVTGY